MDSFSQIGIIQWKSKKSDNTWGGLQPLCLFVCLSVFNENIISEMYIKSTNYMNHMLDWHEKSNDKKYSLCIQISNEKWLRENSIHSIVH